MSKMEQFKTIVDQFQAVLQFEPPMDIGEYKTEKALEKDMREFAKEINKDDVIPAELAEYLNEREIEFNNPKFQAKKEEVEQDESQEESPFATFQSVVDELNTLFGLDPQIDLDSYDSEEVLVEELIGLAGNADKDDEISDELASFWNTWKVPFDHKKSTFDPDMTKAKKLHDKKKAGKTEKPEKKPAKATKTAPNAEKKEKAGKAAKATEKVEKKLVVKKQSEKKYTRADAFAEALQYFKSKKKYVKMDEFSEKIVELCEKNGLQTKKQTYYEWLSPIIALGFVKKDGITFMLV